MAGAFSVEGWKSISSAVGRSEQACREYAARGVDPLPVYRQLGRIVARREELAEWVDRQSRARARSEEG